MAERLAAAERPLFLVGGGVLYSGAEVEMNELAEALQVPVCESQAGKSVMADGLDGGAKNSFCVGGLGVTGTKIANDLAAEADLLVVWGSRLGDFVTSSNTLKVRELIHVNLNTEDAEKMGCKSPAAVFADIKTVLRALLSEGGSFKKKLLAGAEKRKATWGAKVLADKAAWLLERSKIAALPNSDSAVVAAVNKACFDLPQGGCAVCAAGGLPGELHKVTRGYFNFGGLLDRGGERKIACF